MSDRIKVFLIAGALVLGVYLAGCGNGNTTTQTQTTTGYSVYGSNGYGGGGY